MEAIKIFDEHFKKLNSYYALGCRVIKYIFTFASIGLMFIFPVTDDNLIINFYALFCFCYAIVSHTQPYLYTKQNKSTVAVYKLMRDAPINRKAFIASRLRYLYAFTSKFTFACVAVRIFSIFVLEDAVSVERIIISLSGIVLCLCVAVGIAVLDIYHSTRY